MASESSTHSTALRTHPPTNTFLSAVSSSDQTPPTLTEPNSDFGITIHGLNTGPYPSLSNSIATPRITASAAPSQAPPTSNTLSHPLLPSERSPFSLSELHELASRNVEREDNAKRSSLLKGVLGSEYFQVFVEKVRNRMMELGHTFEKPNPDKVARNNLHPDDKDGDIRLTCKILDTEVSSSTVDCFSRRSNSHAKRTGS